jgi:hypothetical protein
MIIAIGLAASMGWNEYLLDVEHGAATSGATASYSTFSPGVIWPCVRNRVWRGSLGFGSTFREYGDYDGDFRESRRIAFGR